MGLDTSHDAFHGSYGAFNRFRQAVGKCCGVSFPPHDDPSKDESMWFYDDELFDPEKMPGLHAFFLHSDCEGELAPDICGKLADEMEALLPKMDELPAATGHLWRGYRAVAERWIKGCREAHAKNEPLDFH